VTQERLTAALREIPTEQLSMETVAARLGVSLATVYKHVAGREELLRLASDMNLSRLEVPSSRDLRWSEWLFRYAHVVRRVLLRHPALLEHARVAVPATATHLEEVLEILIRAGFEPSKAVHALTAVSNAVFGFVKRQLELDAEARAGRPPGIEIFREIARRRPEDLPLVREVFDAFSPLHIDEEFADEIWNVIVGISVRRGDDVSPRAPSTDFDRGQP
jgi:AcrR family transcriptional regulator